MDFARFARSSPRGGDIFPWAHPLTREIEVDRSLIEFFSGSAIRWRSKWVALRDRDPQFALAERGGRSDIHHQPTRQNQFGLMRAGGR